ncbi:MAG: hypothetical protein R2716_13350 [Microthrixaceae bacterium]
MSAAGSSATAPRRATTCSSTTSTPSCAFTERGSGLTCNIGTGVETSVNQLYATMAAAAGVDLEPEYAPARW